MALSGLLSASGERLSPEVMNTVGEALRASASIAGMRAAYYHFGYCSSSK
jgi:hypothetical protein